MNNDTKPIKVMRVPVEPVSENKFEKWEDIDYWYCVSNYGRVWSKKFSRFIGRRRPNGYYDVTINGKSFLIHRLVAEKFVLNPDNLPEVDHIDTNPSNNVWTNLRWVDRKCNQNNPITKNKFKISNKGKKKMRPVIQYTLDGVFVKEYESASIASIVTGIDNGQIGNCCRGYRNSKTAGGYIWKFKDVA